VISQPPQEELQEELQEDAKVEEPKAEEPKEDEVKEDEVKEEPAPVQKVDNDDGAAKRAHRQSMINAAKEAMDDPVTPQKHSGSEISVSRTKGEYIEVEESPVQSPMVNADFMTIEEMTKCISTDVAEILLSPRGEGMEGMSPTRMTKRRSKARDSIILEAPPSTSVVDESEFCQDVSRPIELQSRFPTNKLVSESVCDSPEKEDVPPSSLDEDFRSVDEILSALLDMNEGADEDDDDDDDSESDEYENMNMSGKRREGFEKVNPYANFKPLSQQRVDEAARVKSEEEPNADPEPANATPVHAITITEEPKDGPTEDVTEETKEEEQPIEQESVAIPEQVETAEQFEVKKPKSCRRKLGASVRFGHIKQETAIDAVKWVDAEVRKLANLIQEKGFVNEDGKISIAYGALVSSVDDQFESLSGTLRTCKKQKVVSYESRFLMRGVHDNIPIVLLTAPGEIPAADLETYTLKQVRQVSGKRWNSSQARVKSQKNTVKKIEAMTKRIENENKKAQRELDLKNKELESSKKNCVSRQSSKKQKQNQKQNTEIQGREKKGSIFKVPAFLKKKTNESIEVWKMPCNEPKKPSEVAKESEVSPATMMQQLRSVSIPDLISTQEKIEDTFREGHLTNGRRASSTTDLTTIAQELENDPQVEEKKNKPRWSLPFSSPFSRKNKKNVSTNKKEMSQRNNEEAVVDVIATLVVITGAGSDDSEEVEIPTTDGGDGAIPEEEEINPVKVAAMKIPDTSQVLSRKLGASVRRGELRQERALAAAQWVDKEIRKLIDLIGAHGDNSGDGFSITFGKLFKLAEDVMEAVAGTLKTAKRQKVVAFDAELLMQGVSDHIVISLLKTEIADSDIDTYTYRQIRQCSVRNRPPSALKGKAFGTTTLQNANNKCKVCTKTVYAMEFVGAGGHAFHKSCFRCKQCNGLLRSDNYAIANNVFYCKPHFTELFNKTGGYNFE